MSEHNEPQPRYPQIEIVHHADGTAVVNGVPVHPEPGQHVRDAAYAAAVALVAHCPGPVVATSVEADGAAYRITLYPGHSVLAAAGPASAGRRSRGTSGFIGFIGSTGSTLCRRVAATSTRLPVLRLGWLLTAAIGCMLVAATAAVLVVERGHSSLVRLSVQEQREPVEPDPSAAIAPPRPPVTAAGGAHGAHAQVSAADASRSGNALPPVSAPNGVPGPADTTATTPVALPAPPGGGSSQAPGNQPAPTGSAQPNPVPGGTFRVEGVTLALLGGGKENPSVTYVVTVAASGPNPVRLTYTYSGSGKGAAVTRSMTLSGEKEYAVTGTIPGKPYCGQTVSMRVRTSPSAATGIADDAATPGC